MHTQGCSMSNLVLLLTGVYITDWFFIKLVSSRYLHWVMTNAWELRMHCIYYALDLKMQL